MTAKIHFGVTLVSNRPGRISVGLGRTLLGVLVLAGPLTMRAQDIRPTARAVDEHYNHLRSLQTDFTEIYRGDGAERTDTGTLWLKKPRKMRWEYRSPKEKLFVSDGKVVWFYLPAEKQLRKTEFRKLDDLRSPIAFLLGKTKLENELTGLSKVADQAPMNPANTLLRGVPKAMADRISEVLRKLQQGKDLRGRDEQDVLLIP